MILIFCKECPNLDYKDMDSIDKNPVCLRYNKEIEDIQKDYCIIEETE